MNENGKGSVATVLHLRTVTGRGGGPEKTLLNSHRYIGDGYHLRLAYIRPINDPLYDLPRRAAQAGATLIDIPERFGADPRTLWRLAAEIRSSRPAVLHAHDYKTNVLAVLLGRIFKMRVVTTLHGYGLGGGRLKMYYRVERWALKRMHSIVVVSDDLQDYVLRLGIPPSRCKVVENAVDVDAFRRTMTTAAAKQRLGVRGDRLLVGAVGRLCAEKGFDRLIEAFHAAITIHGGADLVIIGEGEERATLAALIKRLGCCDSVHLIGYQADTIAWYQAMDVFVLSSVREASPNVVLEAMALEVPVAAMRIAGVPKVITDDESGLLIAPGDFEGMIRALDRLLTDEELRGRFAAAGRKTIEARYSFNARMCKIRGIYDELLSGPCTLL